MVYTNGTNHNTPTWMLIVVFAFILVCFGVAGSLDYAAQRAEECWARGKQAYNFSTDSCYKEKVNGKR